MKSVSLGGDIKGRSSFLLFIYVLLVDTSISIQLLLALLFNHINQVKSNLTNCSSLSFFSLKFNLFQTKAISMNSKFWVSVLLLAFHVFSASSQLTIGWLNIDCGNNAIRLDKNFLSWVTDSDFTKAGLNKLVPQKQALEEMNTLRYFPNKVPQNCYSLPVSPQTQPYLVRAGFYYGNYDGLSSPPSFDLHINGNKWSTVKTSTEEGPIYHEAIYVNQGSEKLDVCVVQVEKGRVPFVSSIETVPLWVRTPSMYPHMETNYAYNLVSRINFGGDEVRYGGVLSEEKYNRVWTRGATPPKCTKVSTLPDVLSVVENDPPISVLSHSIESVDLADPINLSIDIQQTTPQSAYFVLYFTEKARLPQENDTRIVQIYINGQMKSTVTLELIKCKVITIYPMTVVGPTINVTLFSASGTLPPMISGMEVFTRVEHNSGHDKSSSPPTLSPAPSYGTRGNLFYSYINFISCICLFILFLD